MKVFIFGAGASKAAQVPSEARPYVLSPLADNLFDRRYDQYWDNVVISGRERGSFVHTLQEAGSVEKHLTEKWAQIDNLSQPAAYAEKALFAKLTFYVWQLFLDVSKTFPYGREINGYSKLLQKLRDKQDIFACVNFNYDTLLDQALELIFHMPFRRPEHYLSNSAGIVYLKPHGSINWFLKPRPNDEEIWQYEEEFDFSHRFKLASSQMFIGGPIPAKSFEVIDPSHLDMMKGDLKHTVHAISARYHAGYFYPLVLIPLTAKLYSSLDGFIDAMIDQGKQAISNATEIFLIGYQAQDDIIKELFSEVKPETKLHVVGLEDSGSIMDRVLEWSHITKGTTFDGGFANFTEQY